MTPFDYAVKYHILCELYDRQVCTGPMGKDGVLPATNAQRMQIEKHALGQLSLAARDAHMSVVEMKKIVSRHDVIEAAKRELSKPLDIKPMVC